MSADFVDTNVLAYAFDVRSPTKQARAQQVMGEDFVTSAQVLQELYVTLTRKLTPRITPATATRVVEGLRTHTVWPITGELVSAAIATSVHHQLSFWDALIVEAAAAAGCTTLLTEDLNDGATIRGIRIENPFAGL